MPPRKRKIPWPAWVNALDDMCLREGVREALTARETALSLGANKKQGCVGAFRSAETTLDQIEFGRVTGQAACKKAAVALRKYTNAVDCAVPPPKKR